MSQTTTSFISPAEKKSCRTNDIGVGCYVRVEPDLSPGNNSHGGVGYVISTEGGGADRTSSVRYLENYGAKTENHVPYSRLTDLGHPLLESGSYSCRRSMPTADDDQECMAKKKQQSPRYLHEILSFGYSKNFAFGWRARELGFHPKIDKRSERFHSILCQDAQEFQGFLAATPKAGKHLEQKQNGNFKASKGKFNPLTMRYLANAWGVSYHMPFNLLQSSNERKTKTVSPMQQSIINRFASAKVYFTGRNLFIQDCVRCQNLAYANLQEELAAEQSPDGWKVARQKQMYIWHEEAKGECISIDSKVREVWESRARHCLATQPTIRDCIIESLQQNPSKTFLQIATDIDKWCSGRTIHHWFTSHGYAKYVECSLPLLTSEQMKRHVHFCERLTNNWMLAPGKYLWIHYDEKWFYGWVNRANAKKCEILGIEKSHSYLYHKNHIDKVMAVAVTAYAFSGNVENGGDGLKLGLYRVQAARIAKRTVRISRRDNDGKLCYDGEIIREAGDAYLVDCNVTGSHHGTSDNPKFCLLDLFRDHIFPCVDALVRADGEYPGYIPVFQGDNTGLHQDKKFMDFVIGMCQTKGWHWEPQAPQMPHMNNLDLAVFPTMSKQHSALLRQNSNKMALAEEIWEKCESVWKQLASSTIARGFVLAYRLAPKVIKHKGTNEFLCNTDFHCNVQDDYYNTPKGIRKKKLIVN